MKEEKTQQIFSDYYFLSNDFFEDRLYTQSIYRTTGSNKALNVKLLKESRDFKEKELLREFNIPISTSNKNLTNKITNVENFLPSIHSKYKSGDYTELANSIKKVDLNNKPKKLVRNSSSITTNSTTSSIINQKNPNLVKIKSLSNLGNLIIKQQNSNSLNKYSQSTKNLKFT